MPYKDRELLFKMQAALQAMSTPVATTFAPQTGQVPPPAPIQSPLSPLPIVPPSQSQR